MPPASGLICFSHVNTGDGDPFLLGLQVHISKSSVGKVFKTTMIEAGTHTPTRGYFTVPNSFVENQALLTRAESVLSLIVLRRGDGKPISDTHWTNWTGLEPRMKDYAEAGLKKKGTLTIEGRGKSARYAFSRSGWEDFVTHAERAKPRTHGRVVTGKTPKPGALIHPECRERGCALLAAAKVAENGETLISTTQFAQPVAQTAASANADCIGPVSSTVKLPVLLSGPARSDLSAQKSVGQNGSRPLVVTKLAQPVARITEAAAQVWGATFQALKAAFPLVDVAFLVRLVSVIRALFPDVQDTELARAVGFAWEQKRSIQKTEGLFLATVPHALGHLRHKPAPRESPPSGVYEGARKILRACEAALRGRGAPFAEHAADCAKLLAGPELATPEEFAWKTADVFAQATAIEDRIFQTAVATLDAEQRAAVSQFVEHELVRCGFVTEGYNETGAAGREVFRTAKTPAQIEALRRQLTERCAASELGIPRLDLFYA